MFLFISTENLLDSIILMGKGMLAIFAVMFIIWIFVKILNIIDNNEANKKAGIVRHKVVKERNPNDKMGKK